VTLDSNSQAIGFGIVLLAIVVGSMIYTKGEAETVAPSCVTSEERIIIRAATLAAIEDGLKDHMRALFAGWIKDPTHQPQRASAGLQAAIVAYQRAREDALKWNPTIC